VVSVHDGDTLTLLVDRRHVKVRLAEINAPELGQPFGNASRQSLSDLFIRKPATVEDRGPDRYGRTIGQITSAGTDANSEQVRRGMAWVYERYALNGSLLYRVQDDAISSRRGLWVDSQRVPPWEWRKGVRTK